MRRAVRFPRRVRCIDAVETSPSMPEQKQTPHTDAVEAYRAALKGFARDTLERARDLDAMRREAVGHTPFEIVGHFPSNCRAIAEKLIAGTDVFLALRQVFDDLEGNVFPLLAVARVIDACNGGKVDHD
uniref:Uncharacterized protein n=1 Tax=uncultured prokaryote TaxID=198431 RepID=A0A0H5Q0N0_9ZZZZ|nr:hypothetical protein [uncultured prokaryote]